MKPTSGRVVAPRGMTRDEKRMENKVEKICSGLSIGLHLPSRRKVRRGLLSHRGSLILLSSVALCLMVLAPFVSFEFSTPRMCTALADSVPGLEADNDGSDAYSWTDTEDGTTVEESDDATEEDGTTVEETDGATEGEDGTTVEETDGATEGEDGTTAEETDGATEAEDGTTSEGGGAGTETEDGTTSEGGGAGTETEGGTTFEGGGAGTAAEEGTVYEGGGAGIEAEEGTVYEGGAGAVEVYGGSAEVIYATNDKQIEQNAVEPVQERSRKTRVSRRVSKIQHSERDRPIVASGLLASVVVAVLLGTIFLNSGRKSLKATTPASIGAPQKIVNALGLNKAINLLATKNSAPTIQKLVVAGLAPVVIGIALYLMTPQPVSVFNL